MDWEKLEYHRTAYSVSEKWLVEAELTPDELEYITHKPDIGVYAEQEYRESWREADKQRYKAAQKRKEKAQARERLRKEAEEKLAEKIAAKNYKFLSATQSKKIEAF